MISQKFEDMKKSCLSAKVVPVLALNNVETAVGIAQALVDGGLNVLEITLRTPEAWDAMVAIKKAIPTSIVGAGTVTTTEELDKLKSLNLDFAVSPGGTVELLEHAKKIDLPFLPGCVTASEVIVAKSIGYDFLKFFPAEAAGGINVLKGINGPLSSIKFCPTGGVKTHNLKDYLSQPNVLCCGGTWLVTADEEKNKDFDSIKKKAKEAYDLSH